ncbi:DUF4932 domain-containing protein [Thermococcus sp.]|uniref:DUF4932 domain-containing protein n=1 Tax=Thermococcus sp. TaxID=35749 RepID=UPI00260384F2|nr:DUF4932 domain-containing protein [Thermococcus sp.]
MKKLLALVLIGLLVMMSGCLGSTPATSPTHQPSTSTTYSPQGHPNVTHSRGFPANASNVSSFTRLDFTPVEANLSPRVHLEIDPRVELIQIIYFIANPKWYQERVSPYLVPAASRYPYLGDVAEYFGNYTNATAVRMVPRMVEEGVAYDAIPEFALHLNPVNFSKAMNWSDMLQYRPWLNTTLLDEFAGAVARFANETDFWKFYNEHRAFYNETLRRFEEGNGETILNVTRFEESFFGENASSWTIVPLTLMSRGGYGLHMNRNGGKYIHAFLGFGDVKDGIPIVYLSGDGITFLVHEFAHSFVNPAVDEYYSLFQPYESLYDPVREKLSMMAYTNFRIMLYETFVRAVEVYYLNVTGNVEEAKRKLGMYSVPFYFIKETYNAYVNDYMKHRDVYRDYTDFMPELAKVVGEVYNRTDGGKKVEPPMTIYDFIKRANSTGVTVAYSIGGYSRRVAENKYRWLLSLGINATLKPVSNLTERELKGNLMLVLYSNSSLLKELNRNALVTVNGNKFLQQTKRGNLHRRAGGL